MSLTSIRGKTRIGVQMKKFEGTDVTIDEINLSNFLKSILLSPCWMNGISIRQIGNMSTFTTYRRNL